MFCIVTNLCWLRQGGTALDCAYMYNADAAVQLLLQHGASVSVWAAHRAATQRDGGGIGLLQSLATNGWDLDTPGGLVSRGCHTLVVGSTCLLNAGLHLVLS